MQWPREYLKEPFSDPGNTKTQKKKKPKFFSSQGALGSPCNLVRRAQPLIKTSLPLAVLEKFSTDALRCSTCATFLTPQTQTPKKPQTSSWKGALGSSRTDALRCSTCATFLTPQTQTPKKPQTSSWKGALGSSRTDALRCSTCATFLTPQTHTPKKPKFPLGKAPWAA